MSDNLDKVMNKLKKPTDAKPEENKEEQKKDQDKEDQDLEDEELEDAELEEEKTTEKEGGEASQEDPKGKKAKPEEEKEQVEDAETTRAREVAILQNVGVFRQELLIQLAKVNENLYVLNSLVDKAVNGEQKEEPKE